MDENCMSDKRKINKHASSVLSNAVKKLEKIKENKTYADIVSFFKACADQSDEIRCGYIFGSRAQDSSYQNEFSDLDIEIIVKDKGDWTKSLEWLDSIGPKKFAYLQKPSDGNGMQVRVLFEDMTVADFVFLSPEEFRKAYSDRQFINGVFGRGIVPLFDKDGLLDQFSNTQKTNLVSTLTAEGLNAEYKDLLFHLIYAKNKIRQGELLVAKDTIDSSIRKSLIKLIRWEEHLSHPDKDLWHRSRHFEKWASPHSQELIRIASPSYQKDEMEKSIDAVFTKATELVKSLSARSGFALDYQADIANYFVPNSTSTKQNFNRGMKP